MENRITRLFNIEFPMIQAGMVWCAGWELAAASANAGILGLIGSGSMYPDILREHIQKCKAHTKGSFGVNVPLIYPQVEEHMNIIAEEGVDVVFTSAGNPAKWTGWLKDRGIKVAHVVSSAKFAMKAEKAGVDAVVAEGFEAGGHNGREETTTMCLVPLVRDAVNIPVLAAGGIGSGAAIAAALALGADGVQVGSRFVASKESSAHDLYKDHVVNSNEGDTVLTLKELAPVRMMKNRFYDEVSRAYQRGATVEELRELLGRGRSKRGMFEGKLDEGELEIGQVSAQLKDIKTVEEIVHNMWEEYRKARKGIIENDW